MNSISEFFKESKQILDSIEYFVEHYIGSSLLRKCGIVKIADSLIPNEEYTYPDNPLTRILDSKKGKEFIEKCISAKKLLLDKIILCFFALSAYRMFVTDSFFSEYKKDTFYRFDKLPHANWERLQLETAYNVISDIENSTDRNHVNALVFDDSLYERRRGKGTQLCSKVFDHNDRKTRLGFRMMTGGWTNGDVFIPFQQSLLTTRDKILMVGPDEKYDRRTLAGKRRERAKTKGTEVVYWMVEQAQAIGIPFDYVLFDTWFSSPAQLLTLKDLGTDVIAMIKKNSTKYIVTNPETGKQEKLDVKEIYGRNRKRRGKSKYLLSITAEISDTNGNKMPVKLIYARNHSNRKDWVCFVCTDISLPEEAVLTYYSMRWSIEVYFKISKSYLKLRTECHSPNYDAITSHMVIVSLRYMILALERFHNTDNRTIEDIFSGVQREVISQMIDTAVILVLDAFLDSVRIYFHTTEDQIIELVHTFIGQLPSAWKERFNDPIPA